MKLVEIARMRVGVDADVDVKLGTHFTLHRCNHDTWHLADARIQTRSRFGNARQIHEDVTHVLTYGSLPPPSGERW